jgi:tetratricopeptide (TPR) repeat protein
VRHLALAFTVAVAAAAVAAAQPAVDATRVQRQLAQRLLFVPDGRALRIASSGFAEPAASVLWIRIVLVFGDRFEEGVLQPEWSEWLRRTLAATYELDPHWRTPYYYGGLMLRVLGDIDGSDAVFLRATDALPNDWFYPFQLGMNHYLHRDDPDEAARWIAEAARRPGAPRWYAAVAAAMRERHGDRDAAVAYLEGILASNPDPANRAYAEDKLGRLRHNALVEGWEATCRAFRVASGRRLESPDELATLLGAPLPPSPRGDAWVVGLDGVVRSEGAERDALRRERRLEWEHAGR